MGILFFGLSEGRNFLINPLPIYVNLILEAIKFTIPTPRDISLLNDTLEGVLS